MRYIITEKDRITRTDTYLVEVECADGSRFEKLEPRRLFPFSDPENYITLLDSDEKEAAIIKSLSRLSAESAEAITACFSDFYMIPVIKSIIEVQDKFGVLSWRVMTDRGEAQFDIRNRHSDIKLLDSKRLLIRDSNDNRYQSDITKLDRRSMKKIFSYI